MRNRLSNWCALVCLTLTACAPAPQPDHISKIAVAQNICDPRCREWGMTLHPDGLVEYSDDGPGNELGVHAKPNWYPQLASMLAKKTAFFSPRTDYRRIADPQDTTWITAWVDGRERQVMIPSLQATYAEDQALRGLRSLVQFVQVVAGSSIRMKRYAEYRRLENVDALESVEFRANGCFGTCPAYTVEFNRDGSATIDDFDFASRKRIHARARIPFTKVLEILRTTGLMQLQHSYALKWKDVPGARLQLSYRHAFSFVSDGPDWTQWSAGFQDISDRFDQLVLDTQWSQQLPRRITLRELEELRR